MKPENDVPKSESKNPRPGFTPEELVHRHMENPDEPITDEDINNLILDIDDAKINNTVEEREKEKDIIQTPYEILK